MHQPLDYPWSGALQPVQVTHRILLPFCLTAIGPVGEQIFTQKPYCCTYVFENICSNSATYITGVTDWRPPHEKRTKILSKDCVHTLCLPPFSWSRTFLFLIIPPSNLLPQAQCQSPSSFSVANLCSSAKTRGGPSSCSSAERAVLWDFFLLFFWYLLNLVGRHGEAWGSHRSTVQQRVYHTAVKCVQVRAKVWASLLKSAQDPQKKGLRALPCTTKSSHGTPSFTPLPRFRPYPNLPA